MKFTKLSAAAWLIVAALVVAVTALDSQAADPVNNGRRPAPATSYVEAVLNSKPAGFWRLDETAGPTAHDKSGNNRDSAFRGAVTFAVPGALNLTGDRAARFDGRTAFVEVPSDPSYSQPASGKGLTVEAWIKPSTLEFKGETNDPYVLWLGKGERGQFEWALRLYSRKSSRPNRISAYLFNRSGGLGAGAFVEEPLKANEWIHIVACFEPGSRANPKAGVSIFKNGALRGSPATQRGALYSSFDIVPQAGNAPVRIGTRNSTSFFAGDIDEVAIYPRVLDAAEIAAHFRAARP
jgi:hypothetical protein